MRYFTSDWHINDKRVGISGYPDLFFRRFKTLHQQDLAIQNCLINSDMGVDDELIHLGDVVYQIDDNAKRLLDLIKSNYPAKWTLIIGNYDEDKIDFLSKYFEQIVEEKTIEIKNREYYLNHYPSKCLNKEFSITGHIHSLWKVQKKMVNVGVDAWGFINPSENDIDFIRNACEHHYDNNVFPY